MNCTLGARGVRIGSGISSSQWGMRTLAKIGAKEAIYEEERDDPAKAARRWESCEELVHALGQMALGESAPSRCSSITWPG